MGAGGVFAALGALGGLVAGHLALAVTGEALPWKPRREHLPAALAGMLAGALAARGGGWLGLVYALALIPHALIDLRCRLVYEVLVLASVALALGLRAVTGGLVSGLLGALVGGLVVLAVRALASRVLGREALGSGDILLAAMIGTMAGMEELARALVWGVYLGGAWAVALLLLGRGDRHAPMPYGTALCAAAIITLTLG
jgi:leader peptidase (prepilin peptidase)/N-methyltransferase